MAPKLYYDLRSPPCRAVLMIGKEIGLDFELKPISLADKQTRSPEFVKLNPQHTLPTLDDDGFVIWDSHAIGAYLVSKYGADDSLYPKDVRKRALVDQRLHFDTGVVFPRLRDIHLPRLLYNEKTIPEHKIDGAHEMYAFLEAFLDDGPWLAGDSITIADMCIVQSLVVYNRDIPIDATRYPNVDGWLRRCQERSFFADNEKK